MAAEEGVVVEDSLLTPSGYLPRFGGVGKCGGSALRAGARETDLAAAAAD